MVYNYWAGNELHRMDHTHTVMVDSSVSVTSDPQLEYGIPTVTVLEFSIIWSIVFIFWTSRCSANVLPIHSERSRTPQFSPLCNKISDYRVCKLECGAPCRCRSYYQVFRMNRWLKTRVQSHAWSFEALYWGYLHTCPFMPLSSQPVTWPVPTVTSDSCSSWQECGLELS